LLEIIEHARALCFNVKLKTNAVLIGEKEARRLRELNIEQMQISVYSHREEVHDGISKLSGSRNRTLAAIRLLRPPRPQSRCREHPNERKSARRRRLAAEVGAHYTLDPTITPMMSGDTSVLRLRLPSDQLRSVFQDPNLVGDVAEFCAPPQRVDDGAREGRTACYVSPRGEIYPCVQFPNSCGNIREQSFLDIWGNSPQLLQVRSIRGKDLITGSECSHLGTCTRCPGLAYMEGNMRGPSSADCEKSFVRTGIVSAGMLARANSSTSLRHGFAASSAGLVHIRPLVS
jgi:radical SAM protein with 4Fe4S-binding SPASM domain